MIGTLTLQSPKGSKYGKRNLKQNHHSLSLSMQAKEAMLTNESVEPYSTKFGNIRTITQDN